MKDQQGIYTKCCANTHNEDCSSPKDTAVYRKQMEDGITRS